ncbi:MAG: hypothetical protein ACPGWS_04885 [Solirubrobacterales bacterium]
MIHVRCECGRVRRVPLYPLRCSCGYVIRDHAQTVDEGRLVSGVAGLGDIVAAVTKAVGIEPCGGCKDRQNVLNRLLPIRGKRT